MPEERLFRSRRSIFLVVGVVLVAMTYVLFTPGWTGGPDGSSYGTDDEGTAAYASLFERRGHQIDQRRIPFDESAPRAGSTVIIMDAGSLAPGESSALERFVLGGGRLIVVGTDPGFAIPGSPDEGGESLVHGLRYPAAGFGEVGEIIVPGGLAWSELGPLVPIHGSDAGFSVGVTAWGDGWVFAVSDPSILANSGLALADNAALGLALAGPPGRVEFAEHVHGFGPRSGFGGLPIRWQWAVAGLALAAILFMFARSRRLGPPSRSVRDLPPGRIQYVDALAAGLQRTGDDYGVSSLLVSEIRSKLIRRGVDPDSPAALAAVAERLGLDDGDMSVVVGSGKDGGRLMRTARVVARLSR